MIDIKEELQEYRKVNLEEIEADGQRMTDDIRNSILLYNKAVDSLSNGSEDIAMIELKKAVSLNPHFYEALNLLGICYTYANDTAKAAEIFNKVIKGESNGVKAQKYLGLVKTPEQDTSRVKAAKRSTAAISRPAAPFRPAADRKPAVQSKRLYVLSCAACFAAGALLIGIISLASHKPEVKDPGNTADASGDTVKIQQELKDYKQKYDELDGRYKLLQQDVANANKKADYYQAAIKLYQVESLVNAKKFEEAADALILLKALEFTGDEKSKFDSLISTVMPKAAGIAYDNGIKLYNNRKYEESLKKLEKVQLYQPDFSRNDAVLYYQGKGYQQLNDSRNAIAAYQKLIDTYPRSAYAKNAAAKLSRLTENP